MSYDKIIDEISREIDKTYKQLFIDGPYIEYDGGYLLGLIAALEIIKKYNNKEKQNGT
ncbi:MAG: hypothetical protein PVI88_00405 [Nitrosopumilaceae archaeon]|jgi:hypothetical protein